MNLIPNFIRRLFSNQSSFVPETPAVAQPIAEPVAKAAKPRNKTKRGGYQSAHMKARKHHWAYDNMKDVTGPGNYCVAVPEGIDVRYAQHVVSAICQGRFGNGRYKTHAAVRQNAIFVTIK